MHESRNRRRRDQSDVMKKQNIRNNLFMTLSNAGDTVLTLPVLSSLKSNFPDSGIRFDRKDGRLLNAGITMNYKRILIIRTDRIGDVVLSLPAVRAVRKAFPGAYVAAMVSPATKDIVKGNPDINEIIIYDKKGKHRNFFKTLVFSLWLKKKKFDIALILHTTARVNLITCLARIPKRAGYTRGKMDFLLTDRLYDVKRLGEKHEAEYSLDLLRSVGIKAKMSQPVVYINEMDEANAERLLKENGLREREKFIAVHPGASCISKRWPEENFALIADALSEELGVRIVLLSDEEESPTGEKVRSSMKKEPVFLCGKTSLGETAALLKKSMLFISNDSGPVHIACAVGTPTISIFGRNQRGLSPERWGPLGKNSAYLHKKVGCSECRAHNCKKGFMCLKEITPEEVIDKVRELTKDNAK